MKLIRQVPTTYTSTKPTPKKQSPKRKLLVHSDYVAASTGFGTVARHILKALHDTGQYEIDQLAINYFGDFADRDEVPYWIVPAKLKDPRDPYGQQMLIDALKKKDYDAVFIINDSFVVHNIAQHINPLRKAKVDVGRKPFQVVYYYPIDCHLLENGRGMIEAADRSVAYTQFAADETKKLLGKDSKAPTDIIYHGTDVVNFFPVPEKKRWETRRRIFPTINDETFVIINVNRNSLRKDIARTILAFSEFKKQVPNSLLYLHCLPKDSGASGHTVDLTVPIKELGLEIGKNVMFPREFNPATGFPIDLLNLLYNCADLYISTHLGEGFGLTQMEAIAAGLPVLIPDNTVTPELLGENGERAYIYPCSDYTYADNCYDPKTEVLTNSGWKYFKDLTYSDELCTLEPTTHEIQYLKPTNIISTDYEGNLYTCSHDFSKIDLAVTENHNLYVGRHKTSSTEGKYIKWEFVKPQEVFNCTAFSFKKDGNWVGTTQDVFILPGVSNGKLSISSPKSIPMDLWLEFFGYFLSEGSTTLAENSHFIIQLRQNPGPLQDRMKAVFEAMGYNPHVNNSDHSGRVVVYNKQLYEYLKPFGKCYQKYIPREFLKLSKSQLEILFTAMMLGDGHNLYYEDIARKTVNTAGGSAYFTSSVRLRDDFQELLLKMGLSGSYTLHTAKDSTWTINGRTGLTKHNLWQIGIRYFRNLPRKYSGYRKVEDGWVRRDTWKEEWIPYKGKVYCATVPPNHTLYIRRNGCPVWSGNSGYRKVGRTEDIVASMMEAYSDWKFNPDRRKKIISNASEWVHTHSWENICKQWVQLFEKVCTTEPVWKTKLGQGEML